MPAKESANNKVSLTERRLAFFYSFLRANFITMRGIPQDIMPFATLNTNLAKDDIRLSMAMRVLNYYGYALLIYIEPKDTYEAATYRNRSLRVNDMRRRDSEMGRLSFLKDFIEINDLRLKDITDAVDVVPSALYHWYQVDDLMVSKIYKLAHSFDRNVRFKIEPFQEEPSNETGALSIVEMKTVHKAAISEAHLVTIWEKGEQ